MNQADQLYSQGVEFLLNFLRESVIEKPNFPQLEAPVNTWLQAQNYVVPKREWQRLRDSIIHAVVGFGPLEIWLQDPSVSEIMVNGFEEVFIEKNGCLQRSAQTFASNEQLLQIINRMVSPVGRRIDESQPMVDARLADGSRINAIIPPLSLKGPVLTIRKFPTKPFTLDDLVAHGSVNAPLAELLKLLVVSQQNLLVSGGTGAGKTSTLNALATLVPKQERLITIEDSAEIRINHPHLVTLESRAQNLEGQGEISIRGLLKNALRMRPDRIIVGEIRGGEAIDMLQAMNTGHQGSITTLHANAPLESLYRLETMVLMGSVKLPLAAIRPQIKQGINWILQQRRLASGERKITEIAYLANDAESQNYQVHTVAFFDVNTNGFKPGKFRPELIKTEGSKKLINWFNGA